MVKNLSALSDHMSMWTHAAIFLSVLTVQDWNVWQASSGSRGDDIHTYDDTASAHGCMLYYKMYFISGDLIYVDVESINVPLETYSCFHSKQVGLKH